MKSPKILLGTVAMEKNRWSTREPSFNASEWLEIAKKDGFDGIELWQEHYTKASETEKQALRETTFPILYNCYEPFTSSVITDEMRALASDIADLNAFAIKFNFTLCDTPLSKRLEVFEEWAKLLPSNVQLWCECHAGTTLADNTAAHEAFEKLNGERYGAIVHIGDFENGLCEKVSAYGTRIKHVHLQTSLDKGERTILATKADFNTRALKYFAQMPTVEYMTVEFTKDENTVSETYRNTVKDLNFVRNFFTSEQNCYNITKTDNDCEKSKKLKAVYLHYAGIDNLPSDRKIVAEMQKILDFSKIEINLETSEEEIANIIGEFDIALTIWQSPKIPESLAENPKNLKYICNLSGEFSKWVPKVFAGHPTIKFTNWGDAPAYRMAEGAIVLLFAIMKNLPAYFTELQQNKPHISSTATQATVHGRNLGIYGIGMIGRKFVELLRPFAPNFFFYDPFCENPPEGMQRCESLEELFEKSDMVAIHAGLCDGTRNTVNKEMLAKLPDGGIIVNTARAGIIVEEDLMQELQSGRLRAALDVFGDENTFPPLDHPIRKLPNVICTDHHIGRSEWLFDELDINNHERIALENLKHFINGEELNFLIDKHRAETTS